MSSCFCVGPPGDCPCIRRQRESQAQERQKDFKIGRIELPNLTEADVRRIIREELERTK